MDPAIPLEPARLADAGPIAALSRDLIETGLHWRWRTDAVLALLRDPESTGVVYREGGTLGGFAVMSFAFQRADAHLVLLAVDPELRRCGVGSALYRWLEALARRGGIGRLALELRATRPEVKRFYEHLGYRETGRINGYYQGREDALRMERRLRTPAGAR